MKQTPLLPQEIVTVVHAINNTLWQIGGYVRPVFLSAYYYFCLMSL